MQQHSQQRQQQRDRQHSQQRSQRHCCGQRADFWVFFSAAAVNNGADAADSYFTAFPQSMMVFAGMAVLGVILAALMFRFSTRRPPELREIK